LSQSSELPVSSTAKFLSHATIPKRCDTCSKPFTRTQDETGQIWFCSNKNCTTRGWGFHQDPSGFILDGVFNKALDHLERYRF
jgi:hypothetical protein